MKMELTFIKERETKGTVRYKEESKAPKIGILYIKKWALQDEKVYPEVIDVTICDT